MLALNDCQKILLELIKQSQFGDEKLFPIDSCDWDIVYSEAISQSVIGIIAPEIPSSIRASNEKWQRIRDQQLAYNVRYFHAESELTKLFEKTDTPFVILKGTSAAIYYRHPERRMMGDIDLLVPQELFEKTIELLSENGYEMESTPDLKMSIPRHVGFKKNKISIELHHHFSREELDIEKYLIEGIPRRIYAEVDSIRFPMLPKLSNGLVLLEHLRAHLQSGLGLRQVVDWMMYVNRELSDQFWEVEFSSIVESKGLAKLAKVTTRMCQIYLGLPDTITWCSDADENLCNKLMENIFISGNFGKKHGSGNAVESIRTKMKKQGFFRWLQIAGEHNWKAYKKHHWLKPFCWIYQIGRYAKQGLRTGRSYKQLSSDFGRGKERYDLLKELGI